MKDLGLGFRPNPRVHIQDRMRILLGTCGKCSRSCPRSASPVSWALQSAVIQAKHGIIQSCSLTFSDSAEDTLKERLAELSKRLQGQRYGFVDNSITLLAAEDEGVAIVWEWLQEKMDS